MHHKRKGHRTSKNTRVGGAGLGVQNGRVAEVDPQRLSEGVAVGAGEHPVCVRVTWVQRLVRDIGLYRRGEGVLGHVVDRVAVDDPRHDGLQPRRILGLVFAGVAHVGLLHRTLRGVGERGGTVVDDICRGLVDGGLKAAAAIGRGGADPVETGGLVCLDDDGIPLTWDRSYLATGIQ